jgi:hypothetical protein
LENLDDSTLIAVQLSEVGNNFGISGTFNHNGNDGTISRFGWKAQNKSLLLLTGTKRRGGNPKYNIVCRLGDSKAWLRQTATPRVRPAGNRIYIFHAAVRGIRVDRAI